MSTGYISDVLDSAWCKWHRANQHLEAFYAEVMAFFSEPGCFSSENEFEVIADDGVTIRVRLTRRIFFKRDPDALRWGAMIGDVVVNLRAALDHMIYAISASNDAAEFADDRSTEFPITDSQNAFERRGRRRRPPRYEIRGLGPDAQAIVEGLQPYHRGNDSLSDDPLWFLREMANIDKHRAIHLVAWHAHQLVWDITGLSAGARVHLHWVRPVGRIESGTPVGILEYSYPVGDEGSMHMDRTFNFTVAFDERLGRGVHPAPDALIDLADYVGAILSAMERFTNAVEH